MLLEFFLENISSDLTRLDIVDYAVNTGATVPASYFSPLGCPTGINGSLLPPIVNQCPLVFEVRDGTQVCEKIREAVLFFF